MCLQVFPLQSGVEGQSNTNVGWTRKQCPSSLSPYLCFFYVFRAEGQDAATAFEPTTSGADAKATAKMLADWVKKYNLDGVDIDYEDFNAFAAGTAEVQPLVVTGCLPMLTRNLAMAH